ncbi:nitroreductase family protein [Bradyrhizobium sp.]|uniref:nitroreductase family protein n=1 Tax=Bradyrhizobium sp. TaxID=376 RepID=UPI001EB3BC45|nr:nitroreductase family protein [Bradyrhizobium sp.]MBV9981454.1 nitroreductase family protein [Bradyrhizobium sp.]
MVRAATSGQPANSDLSCPRQYHGVDLEWRRESARHRQGDHDAHARQALENFNFFAIPHVAIADTDEALGVYGAIDCGDYVTSFTLAAQALGVATIPQAALASQCGVVRSHFGIGGERRVPCGISLGYPDRAHRANTYRTGRASIADTVMFIGNWWNPDPAWRQLGVGKMSPLY